MFYNTGIATYIWVLDNNKPDKRKGRVQLINGVDMFGKMRKSDGRSIRRGGQPVTIILGLAGLRRAGKSTAADHLVAAHGFVRLHPFDGGKAAARGYYMHIGIDEDTAWRMTDGDLKDTPCELLPGNATSRDFLEPFGKFMGVSMGRDRMEVRSYSEDGELLYTAEVPRFRGRRLPLPFGLGE